MCYGYYSGHLVYRVEGLLHDDVRNIYAIQKNGLTKSMYGDISRISEGGSSCIKIVCR